MSQNRSSYQTTYMSKYFSVPRYITLRYQQFEIQGNEIKIGNVSFDTREYFEISVFDM